MDFDSKTGPKPDPPVLPLEKRGGLSLRVRLMLPVLLALVPAFLMLLGDTLEERASFTQRARWRSFGFLNTLSSEIGQNVRSLALDLQALAQKPEAQALDPGALDSTLADLASRVHDARGLAIFDLQGNPVAAAPSAPGTEGSPLFVMLQDSLSAASPDMLLVPGDRPEEGALQAAWPIEKAGKPVGAILLTESLDWIHRRASNSDLPEGSTLNLLDLAGRPVLRHPHAPVQEFRPLPQDILNPDEDRTRRTFERVDPDGVSRLHRVALLRQPDGAPLGFLTVGIPTEASEAKAEAALARNLLVLSLVALVSLATAWILGESLLLRRLRVLSRTIHRLARLDLTARTGLGQPRDEIGRLAWSFDLMAERLERSRRREVNLLESAGEGICGLDPAGSIVFTNHAAEALLGLPAAELPGLPLRGFFSPQCEAQAEAALTRTLRERTRQTVEEIWLRGADGEEFPVDFTSAPMEDPPGVHGAVVVLRDVTERTKARSQALDAHLRLLQAVDEKKAFYREVLNTVSHGRFHLVDAEKIPTTGTEVLDRPLDNLNYARIRAELPRLAHQIGLTEQQASDLVVVFGEAASNAIKHGVDGHCQVFTRPEGLVVRVSDRGPGIRTEQLPATLFESGFSTKVSLGMGFTLMLQLSDTIWLATGPEGTVLQAELTVQPQVPDQKTLERLLARF